MKHAIALATVALLTAAPASAKVFSQLVVFGDSLSDTGNAHIGALALGLGDPTPASVGYYNGRFSNGPEYIDYLHQALVGGPSYPVAPALFGLPGPHGTNYAVGGARAVTNADPSLDLPAQVGIFASQPGSLPLDPNALYVINFGSNDVRAQIQMTADAPSTADAISNILGLAGNLYLGGAHHVLLYNVGDLGSEPVFSSVGAAVAARNASVAFDAALASAIPGLAATGTYTLAAGVTFTFVDTLAFGDALRADPAKFGLPSTLDYTTPCFAVPSALPSCSGYAFADAIHPTSALHQALAEETLDALGVPEPAVFALFGLGVASLALRRRARG